MTGKLIPANDLLGMAVTSEFLSPPSLRLVVTDSGLGLPIWEWL
jgi:hypothetical protein